MNRIPKLIAALFLMVNMTACATHQRSETVQYEDRRTGDPVVVERTTTDRSTSGETGLVSGTVNVIGEVIALPFRAVGGLLRALF